MTASKSNQGVDAIRKQVFVREFDAPRELVWRMWTEPEHFAKWWGPTGFTNPVCELDARPGGAMLVHMQAPNGDVSPMTGEFEVVEPVERLSFINGLTGENGARMFELRQSVKLEEHGGKTVQTLEVRVLSMTGAMKPEDFNGMETGCNLSLDRLEQAVRDAADTSDREIVHSRKFNASRELVFEAWSSHEHLSQWFGPNGFTITTRSMEFEVGGVWSFTMHGPDGTDYPNRVEYTEIVRPERICYRQGTSEEDPEWFTARVQFTEKNGQTEIAMRILFPTVEARNLVVEKYGAIEGGHQTMARLAQVVESRSHEAQPADRRPIRISREFDAPREAVFAAWSNAEALHRWYFPFDCGVEFKDFDFRVGGGFLCGIMPAGDGKACWCGVRYLEITEPARIVLSMRMTDEHGQPTDPAALGMDPEWPAETVVTLNFDALMGGRTRLTLHQTVSEALADRTGALPSWHSMLDHLDSLLKTEGIEQ